MGDAMNGRLIARNDLTGGQLEEMFDLFCRHFEGVRKQQFLADLGGKSQVVWLEDDRGRLVGFSTLLVYRTDFEAETMTVVYSGDTIMEPRAWRSSVLSRTWIESVRRLYREIGEGPLYWLLISSGFRTYRFLPVYFNEFFPRHDRATPARAKRMIDHLAAERFGSFYDRRTGVVRFEHPSVLRPGLRAVPDGKRIDPHVSFFVRANPGHVRGDELVCLTELAVRNLTPAARRIVRAGRRQREREARAS
jgi:hypothetical protein